MTGLDVPPGNWVLTASAVLDNERLAANSGLCSVVDIDEHVIASTGTIPLEFDDDAGGVDLDRDSFTINTAVTLDAPNYLWLRCQSALGDVLVQRSQMTAIQVGTLDTDDSILD